MLKFNLGCGKCIIPGYVNIDILPVGDVVCDVRDLRAADGSVDVIYAGHVLDHFGRNEWLGALEHWYAKLGPSGILRIAVADFEAVCEHYMENKSLVGMFGLLVGGQRDRYDWHGMVFDYQYLADGLHRVGFRNVRRFDWRLVEPGNLGIDDYSQAYLPHMDKEHGRLMSLNVEAEK